MLYGTIFSYSTVDCWILKLKEYLKLNMSLRHENSSYFTHFSENVTKFLHDVYF